MKHPPPHHQDPAFETWLYARLGEDSEQLLALRLEASHSGVFAEEKQFSLLQVHDEGPALSVRLGIFFREYETGCPCSGEQPVLIEGYCVRQLLVDSSSGEISLRPDQSNLPDQPDLPGQGLNSVP